MKKKKDDEMKKRTEAECWLGACQQEQMNKRSGQRWNGNTRLGTVVLEI